MNISLSFIIPVYNGSDFIVRCLESICNLDLSAQEYEIIVIDDCSTDNTRDVVRGYMTSHPQVHLLCQPENHRQGAARNWGIREAKGEYITFVDSDDIILEGVINALHWAKQLQADMVYCSCIHESNPSESVLKQIDMPEGKVMAGSDFCEQYQHEGVFWYPWGFLMRRDWLISLHYPFIEDRQHEDRDWMAYILCHAATVCNSHTPMYRYICNPNSTCRAPRYSTIFDHVASGIRHIQLSEDIAHTCPNLSKTLYAFGYDEIYKSLRFRNLTKYAWTDNKHLYDQQHLKPLLADVKRLTSGLPWEVRCVVDMPVTTSVFLMDCLSSNQGYPSIQTKSTQIHTLQIMNKLLSIVIPVYKVEKYIRKCIESLLVPAEQLSLLDIVIVNDGTPDNSALIAKEYAARYPDSIRVIDQENRGHGGAWNHGTELAMGKYLFYLDSDDWFDTAGFSRLIDYLAHCDTDIVMLDKQNYYAETNRYEKLTYRNGLIEPERIYQVNDYDWIACGCGWKMTYAHDCVYRTSMLQQYLPLFCEHVMYDDVSLQVIPIAIARDFIYTHIDIYRYYIGRPGQSFDPKVRALRAADDVSKVLQFVLDWITKHRSVPPQTGTRCAYMEECYQSMATWHYRELSLFPYGVAKPRLVAWDKFIRTHYPDIRPVGYMRMYDTCLIHCISSRSVFTSLWSAL